MNIMGNWSRRKTLWLLMGSGSSLALHRMSSPALAASAATISLTTWIGNTPTLIGIEKGFFKESGIDLAIKIFPTILESFPSFAAGDLQACGPVTSEVVVLADQNIDSRVVWVLDNSFGADGILARNSIANIRDFKGKRIAVQKGGVGHFFVLRILAEAGLKESDITILDVPPDAATAAYVAGKVDIAYSYSPFIESANAEQKDGRTIFNSSKMPTAIADFYVFRTDFIEKNPEAVEGFVRGMAKSLDFLRTNREEGLAIAAKGLGITPKEVDEQLKGIRLVDLNLNLKMLSDPNSESYMLKPLQEAAQFLKEQNQIKEIPDLSKILDPRFVQKVHGSTT